jgi:PBSX family phage terminase large subunit
MIYTAKQAELMRIFKENRLKRLNILHGSIRSGKTWISLVLWAFWVAVSPIDKSYLMVAKTLTSLKRNCLDLLESLVGRKNFQYSLSQKQGWLFGRKIYLEGVNDARAESKIRGMTLQGAYCDELTLFTEDFFSMLLSRLSEENAKLFATTNPDSPNHWLKVGYIDRENELDLLLVQFLIDDNTTLSPQYVEEIKKENQGVFYDRFILGKWVLAEGIVYPMFDKAKNVVDTVADRYDEYYISIDYGTINPCSMGLWGVNYREQTAVRIREYYFNSREQRRQLTDDEYYAQLEALAGDTNIECIVVDPSAASFITLIRRHGRFNVKKANNDVLDGIRLTGSLIGSGKLKIHSSCADCIRELQIYSWDDKSTTDKVIKENDHAMDDMRYFCNTILRRRFD